MPTVQRRPGALEVDGAGRRQRPCQVQHLLDRVAHAHGLERQGKPTRLDPGDVEDLVDQAQEMSAPLNDLLRALAVLWPLRVEFQELRESENRVEGCTELVAHA